MNVVSNLKPSIAGATAVYRLNHIFYICIKLISSLILKLSYKTMHFSKFNSHVSSLFNLNHICTMKIKIIPSLTLNYLEKLEI